ncbi:protein phosphatase 2a regulatory b subunit (b56 family) protein [Toxoplasma gondii ME49]|uniref:Serine/threonine protein phosphatase 2A regulatory subunit n=6 Tax=Toxoplasma gondii TaxID=5811 RepID=B6KGR6_TOXGV|nr:protein phosphatase 2a regulatory b subunit (b56 family) protein [Toxoplasma gondii ME49]ESS34206.1 protein phosphatase 2a regulatory b subunit (b56 family) protein [Toxoplasma gondii VEG]KFG46935.1 protein phosphatase 2a regulatory b subunit (b56 family) protein [Toxoplasma gondii GAB2-2007-GAL-DOM2]KFG64590.1 protein phosphatase 2a regulatory b subunit (b56 family) protein [Toxoplasma gondii RUB]KFH16187.1 protein phosphatase 2a regulatory b subunit (b56 family) protein [Toxoplasma gondii |eukprot:XP_002367039.1 protein phosphatase 2a regulatory b subunit (b56 family) protein [Toxoplasma gondii ME49]
MMKLFHSMRKRIHSSDKLQASRQSSTGSASSASSSSPQISSQTSGPATPSHASSGHVGDAAASLGGDGPSSSLAASGAASGLGEAAAPPPGGGTLGISVAHAVSEGFLHADSTKGIPDARPRTAYVAGNLGGGSASLTTPFEIPNFDDLPPLFDAPQADRPELFRKKLLACTCIFDFNLPNVHVKEKEAKRQTLLEIVEYVNNSRHCFNDQNLPDVVNMVSANIFRALPPSHASNSATYDPEEEEPTLESSWPHLQIVYEFFLRFIVSNDVNPKVARKYIDQQFVLRLLELFSSEDPRERDYLKTILHRIYGKIMALRLFIRKSIQQVFFRFIYEDESPNGISEFLEILGSIINGFALPLKEEHKLFLERVLVPLHKARCLSPFHQQLTYCMQQYVTKDSRLAEPIILGLLRFWPVTNAPKVVLFLNELEHILLNTQPPEFQKVMNPLFRRLAECIQSPHFQVAERVLFLWNNEHIVKLINQNRQVIFPIVIAALFKNSQYHWNSTVHTLTYNVSKLLAEADAPLFDECSNKHIAEEEKRKQQEEERSRRWEELKQDNAEKTGGEDAFLVRFSADATF